MKHHTETEQVAICWMKAKTRKRPEKDNTTNTKMHRNTGLIFKSYLGASKVELL